MKAAGLGISRLTSAATRLWTDVLDRATNEIASNSKLGIEATKKISDEGFKRPWPPLIKMDDSVKANVGKMLNSSRKREL